MSQVIYHRDTCRGCGSKILELIFSLNPSPIGDAYVPIDKIRLEQPSYPIDLYMCNECGLAQLSDVIDPDILYGEYIYTTTSSVLLSDHFLEYSKMVIEKCKIIKGSLVIDIGSNDGTLLKHFKQQGMKVIGVEPAVRIAAQATAAGIHSIDEFFTLNLAKKIVTKYGNANLITANNVFANIDDLISWIRSIDELLAIDGVFIFESYYLLDLLNNMVFDFIYHEHLSSFSVKPIEALFKRLGFELFSVERVSTKGGSLRYFIQRFNGPLKVDKSVTEMLRLEEEKGLYKKETYTTYSSKINKIKNATKEFLVNAKKEGKSIAGFGASVTGTTLIYHFEIGEYIDYLVDDNPAKQGLFSPGLHIPVYPTSEIYNRRPDYVLLLAWRFADSIIKKNRSYINDGGHFLVPIPEFKIC